MADSAAVRTRRSRAHSRGDHRHCLVSRCPYAGQVERDEVHDLQSAIEVEFAGDWPRLQTARRLVELASGKGAPAVAALTQLDKMIEGARSGRYVPVGGPATSNDEVLALADEIVRLELVRRLDELEAACAALGWEAALASLRVESADALSATFAPWRGVW
jgi:hypothetical protein